MRKLAFPLALLAVVGTVGAASAAVSNGAIKAISPGQFRVTLSDGTSYVLPNTADSTDLLTSLRVGDKVHITWTKLGGTRSVDVLNPVS